MKWTVPASILLTFVTLSLLPQFNYGVNIDNLNNVINVMRKQRSRFENLRSKLNFVNHFRVDAKDHIANKEMKEPSVPMKKPDFCHGLDCPNFKVVETTKDYEERAYDASGWVSTNLEGIKYDEASSKMFMRLFDYISGKNSEGKKIAMTAPVITYVIPGAGPACVSNFTMSFYVAVDKPPLPTDKTVFLNKLPEQKVYVGSFGGFASEKDWVLHASELAEALLRDGKSFHNDHFYTAGYDSPFKVIGRHNEVWYIAK